MNRALELSHKLGWGRIPKWTVFSVFCGLVTFVLYTSWWFQSERLTSPWLLLGFLGAILYGSIQLIGSWLLYIAAYYGDRRRL